MKKRWISVFNAMAILLVIVTSTYAQEVLPNTTTQESDKGIRKLAERIKQAKIQGNPRASFNLRSDYDDLILAIIVQRAREQSLLEAEETRVDKQVGGDATNAGSTSLVTKGNVPAVLGFAVENGALMRTISGTTITFRGNPIGIIKALANKGLLQAYDEDANDLPTRLLRRLSFAVSFDTNRGNTMEVFTGDRQQLSSYLVHYDIYNKRDPRDESYRTIWEGFINTAGNRINNALKFREFMKTSADIGPDGSNIEGFHDPVLQIWYEKAELAIANADANDVEKELRAQIGKLPTRELSKATNQVLSNVENAFNLFLAGRGEILSRVAKGTIISFEYTNNRQVNAPNLSNFNFIAEKSFSGKVDLTANAGFTIFDKKPKGMDINRLRNFQFASQADVPLEVRNIGMFVLSFAGRYERMKENAMLADGTMMMNTKGDIGIGQIKLTMPVKGSGIKIPVSITFANRTELIKEREVRGNIGITFDLDTIFAKFKP